MFLSLAFQVVSRLNPLSDNLRLAYLGFSDDSLMLVARRFNPVLKAALCLRKQTYDFKPVGWERPSFQAAAVY